MRKVLCILCFLFFSTQSTWGQNRIGPNVVEPIPDLGYNPDFVKSYYNNLCITLPAVVKSSNLVFTNPSGTTLDYRTNMPMNYGIGLDYRWLTMEFTTSIPGLSITDPDRGETNSFGFGFGITGRKWWFKNFIEIYDGYHLANSEMIDENWFKNQTKYYHRPDLVTLTYFGSLNYGFNNRKFSNVASLWNLEQQLKSQGSWTIGLSFGLEYMVADSSFVPSALEEDFPNLSHIQGLGASFVGVNFGYLYQWVIIPKLTLSAAFIPGISVQSASIVKTDGTFVDFKNTLGAQGETRLGINYSNEKWYGGATYSGYIISNDEYVSSPLNQIFGYTRFFIGYRIKIKRTRKMKKWFL